VIVSVMGPILTRALSVDEFDLVLQSLHSHGALLRAYLDQERFVGHNHNLFHALSLYNLAVTLPELRDAAAWRGAARSRVSTLLKEMVHTEEGVSTEQASAYHYLALRLFRDARDYLAAHGDGFGGEELSTLRGMVRFGTLLATPGGSLPAVGDTAFGGSAPITELRSHAAVFPDPHAEYVLSRGKNGIRPPDAVFHPESGYTIMRPSYGEDGNWKDDLHVVVDMGPRAYSHGHHDAMNVLVAAYGQDLLIDSGGPYAYGVPERDYFTSAQAHNGVVVDGRTSYEEGARIVRTADEPSYSMVEGVVSPAPGVEHKRTVVVIKPRLVMVFDHLSSAGEHAYQSLYHLPPGASVALTDSGGALVSSDGAGFAFVAQGSQSPQLRLSDGSVTMAHLRRVDAPVLAMEQESRNAWYMAVIVPTNGEPSRVPKLEVDERAGSLDIMISWQGETYHLRANEDGVDFSTLR
ncbi:MAG: heparinase II/III family protein, partial [Chloroflexi bacterium]|nr:heparinase II/III family protein [Chloroflexota bacterium]